MFREEGSAMVEFAVGSTILFLLMFGAMEMCLALYSYHFVSDAAREGARYASVRGSTCANLTPCNATSAQIQSYLESLGYPGASKLTATTTWLSASSTTPTTWTSCGATQCDAPGNAVQVTVTYALPVSIPLWNSTTFNVTSTSQMVIAQ
jgi:Flp pilus assembly protein TadG